MDYLTDDNFLEFAKESYDNPQCHTIEEFVEDVSRIKYVKKLVARYVETGELKERLILNHLVILCNVFGPDNVSRMLYLKVGVLFKYLKPFLVLTSALPKFIDRVGTEERVDTDDVQMDPGVVERLRQI